MRRLMSAVLAAALLLAACSPSGAGDNSGYRTIGTPTPLAPRIPALAPTAGVTPRTALTATEPDLQTDGNAPGIPELHGDIQTTLSGLRYVDAVDGDGPTPQNG